MFLKKQIKFKPQRIIGMVRVDVVKKTSGNNDDFDVNDT